MIVMILEWVSTAAFLILAVLALRGLLKKRISAGLRYALWAVVLVRLLVPVQLFTSPVAGTRVFGELRTEQSVSAHDPAGAGDVIQAGGQSQQDGPAAGGMGEAAPALTAPENLTQYPAAPRAPEVPAAPKPTVELLTALGWVWLAGSVGMALVFALANLRFARRLRQVRIPMRGTGCPLRVYAAVGLNTPCLFGLFRPAVYVAPETAADPVMLRHVLAHETTHFRHLDHVWNLLRCAALSVHWWNPLVWLAVWLSRRDGELACDEGALKRLGDGERKAYGRTLLALVTAKPRPGDLLCCATTMAGDKKSLMERVSRIAKQPKRLLWAAVAAVLILALACAYAFGRAAEPDSETAAFPLAVREHPVAGGAGDYYAIREDGTLVMWGEPDNGAVSVPYDQPLELLNNAAAVYAGPRSAVLAVDRDGGLWSVNTALFTLLDGMGGGQFDPDNPMKPCKVMDDVAMAAAGQFHALILKRDGTLWVAGFGSFGAPWLDNTESYFVQVMENVIWADVNSYGGCAVTADHELWCWGESRDSAGPEKVADGVSAATFGFFITQNGDVNRWLFGLDGPLGEIRTVLADGAAVEGELAVTKDGWLNVWNEGAGQFLRLRAGVRCAAQGEFGVVALLEDGSVWYDGDLRALMEDRKQEHFAADVTGVPGDVLSMAAFYVQDQYESYLLSLETRVPYVDVQFNDWRVDTLEGPWQNAVDGTELEVWRLRYSFHTDTPYQATALLAGGMALTEDGWMTPTDCYVWLIFRKDGGGWRYAAAMETGPGADSQPDSDAFWEMAAAEAWSKILPWTPDLNRNGAPETISLARFGGTVGLLILENGGIVYEDYVSEAPYFLCTLDGQDYLLRYAPYMSQGWSTYSYRLFYFENGEEKTARENSVEFDINFDPLTHQGFDADQIADFMDEINGLLTSSVQIMNTDENLRGTFDKNGYLYDDLWFLDGESGSFVRDANRSLRENLRDYQAAMEQGRMYGYNTPVLRTLDENNTHFFLTYRGNSTQFRGSWDNMLQSDAAPQVLDLNGDGKDEIVFILCQGHGTGTYVEQLYVFDAETLEQYETSGLNLEILRSIESTGDGENFYLSGPGLERVTIPKSVAREKNPGAVMADTLHMDDMIRYSIKDGRVFCWLGCDASTGLINYIGWVKLRLEFYPPHVDDGMDKAAYNPPNSFMYGAEYTTDAPFE